jgi:two-component system alkaline phosphatase synthesis response regulator PhoP
MKILVVEDEQPIRKLIDLNLRLENHEVITAADGYEALQQAEAGLPDLIILDIMLPGLDGWEVLKRLRQEVRFLDTPVVVLTALVQDADIIRGWQLGADEYITKPFSPVALVKTVQMVLNRTPEERKARREREVVRAQLLRNLRERRKESPEVRG